MAPSKRKKTDASVQSLGEMSNGARSSASYAGKDKAPKKPSKKQPIKKPRRRSDKDGASPPAARKKRRKPESGSARSSYAGTDDDSSDEEAVASSKEYPQLPEIGDEIAIKCPPDPPYPEGWYTGVVTDIIIHDEVGNSKVGPNSIDRVEVENFTVNIEWDGGGEEAILNPEWRMKGDAPDKQGRVSHRDAKLRPYFKYWVTRLNNQAEAERKLSRSRAGKTSRIDPNQKVEWIQCSNPSCGKWRAIPPYMQSSAILDSCDNKWFCVLNSWDEAIASCGAAQETGYMQR